MTTSENSTEGFRQYESRPRFRPACHESAKTTKLYDRREDERIAI
jgi:hypothetical protein